jgi:hypothetical protein
MAVHTLLFAHLTICTPSYLHTLLFAHLTICTPSYLHILLFAHLPICTPYYLHTLLFAHLAICTPYYLHTLLFTQQTIWKPQELSQSKTRPPLANFFFSACMPRCHLQVKQLEPTTARFMYASTAHLELNAPGAVTIWQPATSYTGSFFSVATCLTAVTTTSAYPACVTNEWRCLFGTHTCAHVQRTSALLGSRHHHQRISCMRYERVEMFVWHAHLCTGLKNAWLLGGRHHQQRAAGACRGGVWTSTLYEYVRIGRQPA